MLVYNHTGVGNRDTTSSFAPFNTLLGHEVEPDLSVDLTKHPSQVGQDASARLVYEGETVEGFMETHFHEEVQMETVTVIRFHYSSSLITYTYSLLHWVKL